MGPRNTSTDLWLCASATLRTLAVVLPKPHDHTHNYGIHCIVYSTIFGGIFQRGYSARSKRDLLARAGRTFALLKAVYRKHCLKHGAKETCPLRRNKQPLIIPGDGQPFHIISDERNRPYTPPPFLQVLHIIQLVDKCGEVVI